MGVLNRGGLLGSRVPLTNERARISIATTGEIKQFLSVLREVDQTLKRQPGSYKEEIR